MDILIMKDKDGHERSDEGRNDEAPKVKGIALVNAEDKAYEGYIVKDLTIEALLTAAKKYEFQLGETAKHKIKRIEFIDGGYDALETEIEYFLLQISELAISTNWLMTENFYEKELRAEQYTKITALAEAIEDKLNHVKNYLDVLRERHIDEKHNLEGLAKNEV